MPEPTVIALSRPYITRSELVKLVRPNFVTVKTSADILWHACRVLQLPASTFTTAMLLVQRFLLFNPDILTRLANSSEDQESHRRALEHVCCACLCSAYLADGPTKKIEDTIYAVTSSETTETLPDLPSVSDDGVASSSAPPGKLDTAAVISLQREVLETNCFDFRVQHAHPLTIKIAKLINLPKESAKVAWLLSLDAYETTAILQFPALAVAAACIEIATRACRNDPPNWTEVAGDLSKQSILTPSRLLMEHIDRCAKNGYSTHSKVSLDRLNSWLRTLQNSIPKMADTTAPSLRDRTISTEGTARYRV